MDEGGSGSGWKDKKACGTAALGCLESSGRKRLHLRRLIDLAPNTFKSRSHSDASANTKRQPSPVEIASPLYTFYSPTPKSDEESKDEEYLFYLWGTASSFMVDPSSVVRHARWSRGTHYANKAHGSHGQIIVHHAGSRCTLQ